ncbi:MAG TPA: hypothetical protein VHY91_23815 [Pirellulales bacterium]|jgi:hypothetical protein|nr:hypothetical protein [Pirellulales bacterium]
MNSDETSPPGARLADQPCPPQPDYRPAWADLRRRSRWFFGTWLGGFVAILAACGLASWLGATAQQLVVAVLAPAWVIGFVVLGLRLQMFPCPRCHRPFFFRFFYWSGVLVSSCRHCGLPKWSATNCRTPGALFGWIPSDNESAADACELAGDRRSRYDQLPRWRRHIAGLLQISAALIAIVTIIQLAAGLRSWVIERQAGADFNPLLPGVALTLGQALLAGALIEAVCAVLMWWAAWWIERPGQPRQG